MATFTLGAIEAAVRASWDRDTCDDVEADDWTPANPSRGQCGVTALVVHDLLGGQIAVADVLDGDEPQGYHSWLRTAGGLEIDLTREQFTATEVVGPPRFIERPQRRPRRCVAQYELLHRRVFTALGLDPAISDDLPPQVADAGPTEDLPPQPADAGPTEDSPPQGADEDLPSRFVSGGTSGYASAPVTLSAARTSAPDRTSSTAASISGDK